MKLSSTEKIVLGVAVIAIGGALLGFKKPSVTIELSDMNLNPDEEADIVNGLKDTIDSYGKNFAADIEKVLRLETRNFDSKQWKIGNSAGMESFADSFPYGWSSLKQYTDATGLSPELFDSYPMTENNTGASKVFIAFPSPYYFIDFLSWFIQDKRSGDVTKWFSLDNGQRNTYRNSLDSITPTIVNSFA